MAGNSNAYICKRYFTSTHSLLSLNLHHQQLRPDSAEFSAPPKDTSPVQSKLTILIAIIVARVSWYAFEALITYYPKTKCKASRLKLVQTIHHVLDIAIADPFRDPIVSGVWDRDSRLRQHFDVHGRGMHRSFHGHDCGRNKPVVWVKVHVGHIPKLSQK